jgi:hypothetical protein
MPEPPARSEPTAAALLPVLIELFRERAADRLATEAVVAALGERLGRPITANRLTRVLGPCGVRPRQFRLQGVRVWGYLLSDLAEPCDAAPPREAQSAGLSGGSRDAEIRAGGDGRDAAAEWGLHLAMHAARR